MNDSGICKPCPSNNGKLRKILDQANKSGLNGTHNANGNVNDENQSSGDLKIDNCVKPPQVSLKHVESSCYKKTSPESKKLPSMGEAHYDQLFVNSRVLSQTKESKKSNKTQTRLQKSKNLSLINDLENMRNQLITDNPKRKRKRRRRRRAK